MLELLSFLFPLRFCKRASSCALHCFFENVWHATKCGDIHVPKQVGNPVVLWTPVLVAPRHVGLYEAHVSADYVVQLFNVPILCMTPCQHTMGRLKHIGATLAQHGVYDGGCQVCQMLTLFFVQRGVQGHVGTMCGWYGLPEHCRLSGGTLLVTRTHHERMKITLFCHPTGCY